MELSGKLSVGFLDEDNPIKSFFRMKPILTEGQQGFELADTDDKFPEEGFIRVVPDKNEMTMFKTRMRQLGRYCALDLRKHLSENDKIRPNKNYIFGGPEHNQHIVYSDVIGRVPPHLIAEIIECDERPEGCELALNLPMPGTVYVLILSGGTLSGPWSWSYSGTELKLVHAQCQPFAERDSSVVEGRVLDVPLPGDATAKLMYDLTSFELHELTQQEFEQYIDVGLFGAQQPQPQGYAKELPHDRLENYSDIEQAGSPEVILKAAEQPWLSKSDCFKTRMPSSRLSFRDQMLQAQSGINPRRGRSLHEVVDEQWRKSRYDQLGHPVPAHATGRPIASPIERATNAVSEAWAISEARQSLLVELLKIDELQTAMAEQLSYGLQGGQATRVPSAQLDDLEAKRLSLLNEIDSLKAKRTETKAKLMDELINSNRDQIDSLEQKKAQLQREIARSELAAKAMDETAHASRQLLQESQAQLDDRLKNLLVMQHLARAKSRGGSYSPVRHIETYDPTSGELISDLRVQLRQAGYQLTNDEAVNLMCCMMAGNAIILSGASGSGKSALARNLADALGLKRAGRFLEVRDPKDERVNSLLQKSDGTTPVMILLDDFNTGDCETRMNDILELQESASVNDQKLCLVLTAQDAPEGKPISPRMLGRSFMIRLSDVDSAEPWKPAERPGAAAERTVSLAALRSIFKPSDELPAKLNDRLSSIRRELSKLSYAIDRRTLNELWFYCATAQRYMHQDPIALLDLALSQRAVPQMLASMELDALHELPTLLVDMPKCLRLMDQPLPLPPV